MLDPENTKHPHECLLSEVALNALRARNLDVDDYPFFPPNHVSWPSGYHVNVPAHVQSNRYLDFEYNYTNSQGETAVTHMPVLTLWGRGTRWSICVAEYIPGPGPGDFVEQFNSETEAVAAIIKYFFEPNAQVESFNAEQGQWIKKGGSKS